MVIALQDDVEKMAEVLYNPSSPKEIKANYEQLSLLYESSPGSYMELFEYFVKSKKDICQFWILQTLINYTNNYYTQYNEDDKENFRTAIINIISQYLCQIQIKIHVSNKFCQFFINWIKFDFPENCKTTIPALLDLVYKAESDTIRINLLNHISQIMITFDDEMIKFRHTQSDFDITRSNIIKDHMRDNNIKDIVTIFNSIIENGNSISQISKKLVSNSIKVLSQLIDWNNLDLFTDSIKIMLNFLYVPDFQGDTLFFLSSIINKGMDIDNKLNILNFLNVSKVITDLLKGSLNESSFANIIDLINDVGCFLVEMLSYYKNPKNASKSKEVNKFDWGLMKTTISQANMIMSFKVYDYSVLLHFADFLTNLIGLLKSNEEFTAILTDEIKQLSQSIYRYLLVPRDIDLQSENCLEHAEEFSKFRSEFVLIYQNIFYLKPLKEFVIGNLESSFQHINSTKNLNLNEIELPFYLLLNLQHSLKDENDHNLIMRVLKNLFQFKVSEVNSEFVLLSFHEVLIRYISYYMSDFNALEYVVNVYMGNKGIYYENYKFGTKIIALFIKFLEKTKALLRPVAKDLIDAMKKILDSLIFEYKNLLILNEYSNLYQGIGILINQKYFDEDTKCLLLTGMLENIVSISSVFGLDGEKFNLMCKILTSLIKNFNAETSAKTKEIYFKYISIIIKEYYPPVSTLNGVKYSIIIILQRLLIILGKDSLLLIDYFLNNEIKYPAEDIFEDVMKLLQNTCQILKLEAKSLILKNLHFYYHYIKLVPLAKSNISEIEKISINFFANFTKLIGQICVEFVEVFYSPQLENIDINELLKYLVYLTTETIDVATRKTSVKNIKLIITYLLKSNETNNLFIIEYILNSTFEFFSKLNLSDVVENSTFNDIVSIHALTLKANQDFYIQFLKKIQISDDSKKQFYEVLSTFESGKTKSLDFYIKIFNELVQNNSG